MLFSRVYGFPPRVAPPQVSVFLSTAAMDRNNSWYPHQNTQYSYQDYTHNQPQDPQTSRVAADSVQDAHGLLAAYPMASATPSTHGMYTIFTFFGAYIDFS